MPKEQLISINRDDFIGQCLALGVATQLLSKFNGFSVERYKEVILSAAEKQLNEMSEEEKDAITAPLEPLKKQLTDTAYEVVCCHAIALAMGTDLLAENTDKSGEEWRLILTDKARKFYDGLSGDELETFLTTKYPFLSAQKSE